MSEPQWPDPVGDLRKYLSDGPTDKLAWDKKVIGIQNGLNRRYKTFEIRRVTAFVDVEDDDPTGVFLNYEKIDIDSEDLDSGMFVISPSEATPNDGDTLTATYYYQWFTDDELNTFLTSAAQFALNINAFNQIQLGLQMAATEYAAATAYQKLAARFAQNYHEQYQLYDAPDEKRQTPAQAFMAIAEKKFKLAFELRDDFYNGRKGQASAPITATIRGRVRDVPPNR